MVIKAVIKPQWCLTAQGLATGKALCFHHGVLTSVDEASDHPAIPVAMGRLALPGFVNAHSHAFQRAFRGHVQWRAADQDDFWSWRDRMYATANALSAQGVEAVSALAFLEMARAGITTVGEFHYLQHQRQGAPYEDPDLLANAVIRAARRVGIRICLLRTAYLRAGAGQPLRQDQRRFGDPDAASVLSAIQRLKANHTDDGVTIGLAAHSVRALDKDSLQVLSAFDGVVHAHVSEQPAENEACQGEHGCSPLALFERVGLLTDRFTAVHLTWPLQGDVERLVASGAGVCVCPGTELDLGDGFLPNAVRLAAPLCIGSDSHATIEPLAEARAIELHARALAGRRNVLAAPGDPDALARRILHIASTAGSRALGGSGQGLAVGAPADVTVLDLRRTAAVGVPPLEAAAFVATPEWVQDVYVAGVPIVRDGAHPAQASIEAEAREHLSA